MPGILERTLERLFWMALWFVAVGIWTLNEERVGRWWRGEEKRRRDRR